MQRLIAVLSCRGVRKASLSDGAALLEGVAAEKLSEEDLAALRGAGWRPGTMLRELLNYAGEPKRCQCGLEEGDRVSESRGGVVIQRRT